VDHLKKKKLIKAIKRLTRKMNKGELLRFLKVCGENREKHEVVKVKSME